MFITQSFHFSFLLQRNRVVDSVVPQHLLCSTWVPNFSRFEFFPTLLQKKEWSYNASSSYWIICSSVHPISGKYLRYVSSLCHLSKMVLYPPCLGLASFLQHLLGCSTFVAVRKLNVWHHGWGSFLWRNTELIRRRSSSSPTFLYFAKALDISHMNSTQCQFPNTSYNLGIVSWKRFRKARRSRYCLCRWSTSFPLRWTY